MSEPPTKPTRELFALPKSGIRKYEARLITGDDTHIKIKPQLLKSSFLSEPDLLTYSAVFPAIDAWRRRAQPLYDKVIAEREASAHVDVAAVVKSHKAAESEARTQAWTAKVGDSTYRETYLRKQNERDGAFISQLGKIKCSVCCGAVARVLCSDCHYIHAGFVNRLYLCQGCDYTMHFDGHPDVALHQRHALRPMPDLPSEHVVRLGSNEAIDDAGEIVNAYPVLPVIPVDFCGSCDENVQCTWTMDSAACYKEHVVYQGLRGTVLCRRSKIAICCISHKQIPIPPAEAYLGLDHHSMLPASAVRLRAVVSAEVADVCGAYDVVKPGIGVDAHHRCLERLARMSADHDAASTGTLNRAALDCVIYERSVAKVFRDQQAGLDFQHCPCCPAKGATAHVDGIQKLTHYAKAGAACRDRVQEAFKDSLIIGREVLQKHMVATPDHTTKGASQRADATCGSAYLSAAAANTTRTKAVTDISSCIMAVCKHNIILKAVNAELMNEKYILYDCVINHLPPSYTNLFVDVACKLSPWIRTVCKNGAKACEDCSRRVDAARDPLDTSVPVPADASVPLPTTSVSLALAMMHGQVHDISCQLQHMGIFKSGLGWNHGETGEQVFSVLGRVAPIVKHQSIPRRNDLITMISFAMNSDRVLRQPARLRDSYMKAIVRCSEKRRAYDELELQLRQLRGNVSTRLSNEEADKIVEQVRKRHGFNHKSAMDFVTDFASTQGQVVALLAAYHQAQSIVAEARVADTLYNQSATIASMTKECRALIFKYRSDAGRKVVADCVSQAASVRTKLLALGVAEADLQDRAAAAGADLELYQLMLKVSRILADRMRIDAEANSRSKSTKLFKRVQKRLTRLRKQLSGIREEIAAVQPTCSEALRAIPLPDEAGLWNATPQLLSTLLRGAPVEGAAEDTLSIPTAFARAEYRRACEEIEIIEAECDEAIRYYTDQCSKLSALVIAALFVTTAGGIGASAHIARGYRKAHAMLQKFKAAKDCMLRYRALALRVKESEPTAEMAADFARLYKQYKSSQAQTRVSDVANDVPEASAAEGEDGDLFSPERMDTADDFDDDDDEDDGEEDDNDGDAVDEAASRDGDTLEPQLPAAVAHFVIAQETVML